MIYIIYFNLLAYAHDLQLSKLHLDIFYEFYGDQLSRLCYKNKIPAAYITSGSTILNKFLTIF